MKHTKYTKISTIRKFPAIRYFKVGIKCKFIEDGKISSEDAAIPSETALAPIINVKVLQSSKRKSYNKKGTKKLFVNKPRS